MSERPGLRVIYDIDNERVRQDAQWGVQNHPDGTGPEAIWVGHVFGAFAPSLSSREVYREWARYRCQERFKAGLGTWEHILTEEYAEALAEEDPIKLRTELIQLAAVAAAWAEAIDRRLDMQAAVIDDVRQQAAATIVPDVLGAN